MGAPLLALQARSQVRIPEGAKSFAMKFTRQGSNDGELIYPKYIHRVQSEASEGAMGWWCQCNRLVTGPKYSITSGAHC